MRYVRQASAVSPLGTEGLSTHEGLRIVQRAPGPEAPDSRDKGGAQIGMLILLAGGAAFWVGMAILAAHFLH